MFHTPVRDSAGLKLLPRMISVGWEDFAGVADSVVLPSPYYPYDFDQFGLSACH